MRNKLKNLKKSISENFKKKFNRERLNELARKTGFVQRVSSKLKGFEIIEAFSSDTVTDPYISYEGLCSQIEGLNPAANMTPQALEQRVNSPECVEYLKTVFEESINGKLLPADMPLPKLLDSFENIYLEDSTTVTLHEKLADEFRGSGGSASKAAVKVDCIYELRNQRIAKITLKEGTNPDQNMAAAINDIMKPGDLRIADLGYFSVPSLMDADANSAFYLSRLLKSCHVYLQEDDQEPANLSEYLNRNFPDTHVIDLKVYIGKQERFPVRLIAYRLPQEVVAQRRRKARKSAQKKGRTPTRDYIGWLEFSFFITNVPDDIWPPEIPGTIYRIRWQIELIFKNWKSLLNIHVLRGFKPERIKCLIYGKLIAAAIMTMGYRYATVAGRLLYQREISFFKMIGWVKREMRLKQLFHAPYEIFETLDRDLKRLSKQKRTRKTTLELIQYESGYLEYENS